MFTLNQVTKETNMPSATQIKSTVAPDHWSGDNGPSVEHTREIHMSVETSQDCQTVADLVAFLQTLPQDISFRVYVSNDVEDEALDVAHVVSESPCGDQWCEIVGGDGFAVG